MKSLELHIFGLVQGVGFRPFIYSLATKLGLFGEVFNDSSGVKVRIYGEDEICYEFANLIVQNKPPLARIDEIQSFEIDLKFSKFEITSSKDTRKIAAILPDFAICDECKKEFYDPKNRRFHHPFINCTNCGTRFSIIKALPYDRSNTSMAKFDMCDECKKEYENPKDRRYHAQPICCNECGVSLSWMDSSSKLLASGKKAINECIKAIKSGKIVAIKGIGGFHIVCNATKSSVIEKLRQRKNRPDKPFAIMCKDEFMASKFGNFSPDEFELLSSNIKPIVLVKSKNALPKNLAPNINLIGIFLPPTALHLLLFEGVDFPLIATSANISGDPIITNSKEILSKLSPVIDNILDNDRDIINPSDDSIAFRVAGKTQWIRTSRGIKPEIRRLNLANKGCFLALGSELKNQFCIYKDGMVFSSPYIGDLKNIASFERFLNLIDMFVEIYGFEFDFVVGDLHPHFSHTKHFEKLGYKVYRVQHHWTHLLSVMLENSLKNKVLGVSFDGTGYASSGEIWGGEFLICDTSSYERILHFDEFFLIGGDKAIKHIYYLTFSILKKYDIYSFEFENRLKNKFGKHILENLNSVLNANLNLVKTSSLGRIFDAFACLVLGIDTISYDALAPMELEALYDESLSISYEFKIYNTTIDYSYAFKKALVDDKVTAATGFINGIADLILQVAKMQALPVVLSGGVFQNRSLLERTIKNLSQNHIEFYTQCLEPTNDSGIAKGQIYYGLNFLSYNK